MIKLIKYLIIFSFVSFVCSSCSVYMAANQPDKKDIELLKKGTPRSLILAEFGNPISSEVRTDNKKYEIFTFTQGYSSGAKAGRAVFHGTADLFTGGLWEVVGTPTEAVFDGEKMAYQVTYDENDLVDEVVILRKN